MEFKDRVALLRNERGLTLTKAADQFDKSEGAIRMWETGRSYPDVATLMALSEFYGVTTDYLLGLSNSRDAGDIKQDADDESALLALIRSLKEQPLKSSQNPDDKRSYYDVFKNFVEHKRFQSLLLFIGKLTDPTIGDWAPIPFDRKNLGAGTRPATRAYMDGMRWAMDEIINDLAESKGR